MMGMYWCAESDEPLTETIRIRDCMPPAPSDEDPSPPPAPLVPVPPPAPASAVEVSPPCASAQAMLRRLMWLRARVSAPAIMVAEVDATSDAVVEVISSCRFRVTCSSTTRKGRYLLTCAGLGSGPGPGPVLVPFWLLSLKLLLIDTSPSLSLFLLLSLCL